MDSLSLNELFDLQSRLVVNITLASSKLYDTTKEYSKESIDLIAGEIKAYAKFIDLVSSIMSHKNVDTNVVDDRDVLKEIDTNGTTLYKYDCSDYIDVDGVKIKHQAIHY